jgi:hypothetical protein
MEMSRHEGQRAFGKLTGPLARVVGGQVFKDCEVLSLEWDEDDSPIVPVMADVFWGNDYYNGKHRKLV